VERWLQFIFLWLATFSASGHVPNSTLELTPGVHELRASAKHPSGQFTAWATNWFTNSIAAQTATDTFDGAGFLTQRVWKNPNATTNRTQTLTWNARGRLFKVTDLLVQSAGRKDGYAAFDERRRRNAETATTE
jgi:YD repeat-containing protein